MKISRNKLKKLVEQSMKRMINEDKKANNWEEYIAVGKNQEQKNDRRKVMVMWQMWTDPTSQYSYRLMDFNLPVNPTQFTSGYEGWNDWYKAMMKNKEAMASMGKNVGDHFSVADHFKYVDKFFPKDTKDASMKLQTAKLDKQVVDNLMSGLNFEDALKSDDQIQNIGKTKEIPEEKNIFGFKEPKQTGSGTGAQLAGQSLDQWLLKYTIQFPPASKIPLETQKTYPLTVLMYSKAPEEFWKLSQGETLDEKGLAKVNAAKKYTTEDSLSDSDKSALAMIKQGKVGNKNPASATSNYAGQNNTVKESRYINENKIRAIIRHELIKSSRKR